MNLEKMTSSGPVQDISAEKRASAAARKNQQPVEEKTVKKPVPDRKQIEKALSSIQNTRLSYTITDEVNRFIVKIIDKKTDKVIKQIPSEELQILHENLQEAIGLLFDQEI